MRLLRQQKKPACLRAVKRSLVGAVDQIRGFWASPNAAAAVAASESRPRRRPKSTALKTKQQSWRQTLNLETVKCVQMASDLANCAVHSGFSWSFDVCTGPQPTWTSQPTTPYPAADTPRLQKRASAPPQTHNIPKGNTVIDIVPIPEEFDQAIPLLDMSNKPSARPHSFI